MNYYQILGISSTASQEEIKVAFKKLAKEFHPDKHRGSDMYEDQFKKINSAYQTLSDPVKKARYDLKLKYAASSPLPQKNVDNFAAKRAREQKSARAAEAKQKRAKEKKQEFKIYIFTGSGFIVFLIISMFFYNYMNEYSAKLSVKKGIDAELQKKYYQAMEFYSQALEFDDENSEAYKRRADIKLNIYSNYRSALPDYSGAIKYSKKEEWSVLFSRARCCAKLGMYEEAIRDLNNAIRLNPANDSLLFYRAEINGFTLKNYPEAVTDYDLIISRDPSFPEARYSRSLANLASHQYQKAMNDLSYLIDTDSGNGGKYFFWRGFSKVSAGDTSGACSDWKESLNMGIPGSQEQIEKYCGKR
jgi:curved DNA-binding protein CbpA